MRTDPRRTSISDCCTSTRRAGAAEAQYKAALTLDPSFVHGYVNLADLYRSMGREADGEEAAARHYNGIIAIGIDKGDELVGTTLTDGAQIIFLASHDGQAIRFDEADVRPMGRPAYGVRGMNLDEKDYIVGMATTPKDPKKPKPNWRRPNRSRCCPKPPPPTRPFRSKAR